MASRRDADAREYLGPVDRPVQHVAAHLGVNLEKGVQSAFRLCVHLVSAGQRGPIVIAADVERPRRPAKETGQICKTTVSTPSAPPTRTRNGIRCCPAGLPRLLTCSQRTWGWADACRAKFSSGRGSARPTSATRVPPTAAQVDGGSTCVLPGRPRFAASNPPGRQPEGERAGPRAPQRRSVSSAVVQRQVERYAVRRWQGGLVAKRQP